MYGDCDKCRAVRLTPVVHEIAIELDGSRHGTDGLRTVSLLEPEGRMFKRRAVKGIGTDSPQEVCWLVTELNGVRVYQHGDHIVVTTKDLHP
jgi:hypothetical protein